MEVLKAPERRQRTTSPSAGVAALAEAIIEQSTQHVRFRRADQGMFGTAATLSPSATTPESDVPAIEEAIFRSAIIRWLADVAESSHGP
jgi:hypothetical protein